MKRNRIGTALMRGGLLLLAAAFCLTAYNFYIDRVAGKEAERVAESLRAQLLEKTDSVQLPQIPPQPTPADADNSGEVGTEAVTSQPEELPQPTPVTRPDEIEIPDYILDPYMDMPTLAVGGESYIGLLDIPVLELALPIIEDWSYASLKHAPCRFSGSLYLDDLVILGHNYRRHFGRLTGMIPGDLVTITDAVGNVFSYELLEFETIDGNDKEGMLSGDWDMTLFTCTMSGQTRAALRFARITD